MSLDSVIDIRLLRLRRAWRVAAVFGPHVFELAERYARAGLAEAQYLFAQMLVERRQAGDMEAASRWYESAARQGHIEACKALWRATTINAGPGAIGRSLDSIVRAANFGDYQASGVLIVAYGDKPDAPVPNMLGYLKRHAERGHAYAQLTLGHAYEQGYFGLLPHPEKAFDLYTRAAQQGDAQAQCCVGICYARGFGIQQDDTRPPTGI